MAATPGTVRCESIRFLESAGSAAGTYTASVVIPAGTMLIDVIVHQNALWTAATSATLKVGDTTDDDGIFTAVDLKATDLLAGESINLCKTGAQQGADVDFFTQTVNTAVIDDPTLQHVRRRALTTRAARTMKATVTTVGTVGTAGDTEVLFVYAYPSPMAPTFTAT